MLSLWCSTISFYQCGPIDLSDAVQYCWLQAVIAVAAIRAAAIDCAMTHKVAAFPFAGVACTAATVMAFGFASEQVVVGR